MYLIWVENEAGASAPVCVNRPRLSWIGPIDERAAPGSAKRIFGFNLAHDHGKTLSHVYCRPAGGGAMTALPVTAVEPYAVTFTAPAQIGSYQVYVPAGHGGADGWSAPLDRSTSGRSRLVNPHLRFRDVVFEPDGIETRCTVGVRVNAGELATAPAAGASDETAKIGLSFGHRAREHTARSVQLLAGPPGVRVSPLAGVGLEADDQVGERAVLHVGAGDVDAVTAEVSWKKPTKPPRKLGEMWEYLFQHSTPEAVARLKDDPGRTPDAPVLTVQLAEDGTRGFSIGLEQLQRHKAMWLPEHDLLVTLADAPVEFAAHLASLKGERVLDRVKREPEATLADFTSRWEDMGDANVYHSLWAQSWLGETSHVIPTAGAHGSLYKFGIYRSAAVRPDLASPHKFRFDPLWPGAKWNGQRLTDGLPVVVTSYTREGKHIELEQFAAPRERGRAFARGEHPMVFYTKAAISGAAGPVKLDFRLASESKERHLEVKQLDGQWYVADRAAEIPGRLAGAGGALRGAGAEGQRTLPREPLARAPPPAVSEE